MGRKLINQRAVEKFLGMELGTEIGNKTKFNHSDSGNQGFDMTVQDNSQFFTVEVKERLIPTIELWTKRDVLIELTQNINDSGNKSVNPHALNASVGWFYKCNADYLLYVRYFTQGKDAQFILIPWKEFKNWLIDQMEYNQFSQSDYIISHKTTGSINLCIPLSKIPKRMITTFECELAEEKKETPKRKRVEV